MRKATKEAKVHTSWINDNVAYDEATRQFVERALTGPTAPRFLASLLPFQARVARLGMINSLAQVLLKATVPGVPDFYQGTELWDLTLVDPDNRRPVDFDRRMALLDAIERWLPPLVPPDPEGAPAGAPASASAVAPASVPAAPFSDTDQSARLAAVTEMLREWRDGRVKLYVTASLLRLRRLWPELFLRGDYVPLDTDLSVDAGLVAFARTHQHRTLIVIAPRLVSRVTNEEHWLPCGSLSWRASRVLLPAGFGARRYRNLFTGEDVRPAQHEDAEWIFAGDALRTMPVALLIG
jgi:(1->4)-alpha-D-glucan 1-alpha-D-glucosylmutase